MIPVMTSTKTERSTIDLAGVEAGEKIFVPWPAAPPGSTAHTNRTKQDTTSAIRETDRRVDLILRVNIIFVCVTQSSGKDGSHSASMMATCQCITALPAVLRFGIEQMSDQIDPSGCCPGTTLEMPQRFELGCQVRVVTALRTQTDVSFPCRLRQVSSVSSLKHRNEHRPGADQRWLTAAGSWQTNCFETDAVSRLSRKYLFTHGEEKNSGSGNRGSR